MQQQPETPPPKIVPVLSVPPDELPRNRNWLRAPRFKRRTLADWQQLLDKAKQQEDKKPDDQ